MWHQHNRPLPISHLPKPSEDELFYGNLFRVPG
jgi:hypothetical protein